MKKKEEKTCPGMSRYLKLTLTALALMTSAFLVLSCTSGSRGVMKKTSSVKKPPGLSQNNNESSGIQGIENAGASGTSSKIEEETEEVAREKSDESENTPRTGVSLLGVVFTVVKAARKESNSTVISSNAREVKGDYLEIELEITNSSSSLARISDYSFRISSPGIIASDYYDYYGATSTYGGYVSSHVISGTLMYYSTLGGVSDKLKIGETLSDVFLFFDLNPKNAGKNPNVTKENTELIIKKVSGSGYGTTVSVPLAGYPD